MIIWHEMRIPKKALISFCFALLFCAGGGSSAQRSASTPIERALKFEQPSASDREAASIFAPIFYQALGDKPRSDYITDFDFDGDWRGDNNWDNAELARFPLRAYVYYAVSETSSHLFIHYAVFHPRDYKGGERKGAILSELMREGAKRGGKYDPTGLAVEASVAHENDMEGCLLVVAKKGGDLRDARVVFVETLHHNIFSKYITGEADTRGYETIKTNGQRILLYVEPKGHGIVAYDGGEKQTSKKRLLMYLFGEKAEEPKEDQDTSVSYDLVPIQRTLWSRAQISSNSPVNGMNATYGAAHNFGALTINVMRPDGRATRRTFKLGKLGSAFLGKVGGLNMAKPPWAWADRNYPNAPLGQWFFDPAQIIKRDFKLDQSFSTAYVRLPFWAAGP